MRSCAESCERGRTNLERAPSIHMKYAVSGTLRSKLTASVRDFPSAVSRQKVRLFVILECVAGCANFECTKMLCHTRQQSSWSRHGDKSVKHRELVGLLRMNP